MTLFLPTYGTGNSLALATFAGAGEIMGFFYPHLDFAQNVREGMHALYLHGGEDERFLWCFADCFERSQSFRPGTNVLATTLRHRTADLTVETIDLLPPGEHALVRRISVTRGPEVPPVSFMQYFNLAVGDVAERNAVHLLPESRSVVQHFRDISLAVALDRPFSFEAGAVGADGASATKESLPRGSLCGSQQAMGSVDFAIALDGGDERRWEATLVLAGAHRMHRAALLADLLEGGRRIAFVERFRPSAVRAVGAILRHIGDDGLHRPAADLWECSNGSFPYTQAAVIAALRDGTRVFDTPTADLERLRRALFDRLWNADGHCWFRWIDPQGNVDPTLDSSSLGVIEPWGVLDLNDPRDRAVAEQTITSVAERMSVDAPGGRAILRFENESYMGGGPGCVNTLWAAQCRLRLAAASRGPSQKQHVAQARQRIDVALANTNPTGQLPELIPNLDFGYWAAPHGWASSLLIECVLAPVALR